MSLIKYLKARQTRRVFQDKWANNPQLAVEVTLNPSSEIFKWILGRNGFSSVEQFRKWVGSHSEILDAGCGNGRILDLFISHSTEQNFMGIDLSTAIASQRFLNNVRVNIVTADISKKIHIRRKFDLIYCQEVLHHTSNPKRSFRNLVQLLAPGGEIAIYVYKKKSPSREFLDEYIRKLSSKLDEDSKKKLMREITEFGSALSSYDQKMQFPGIHSLDIAGGTYTTHKFLYDNFFKCFWNPMMTFDENLAVNEDWYLPSLSSKHEVEEVREWFRENNIQIIHECVDEYGITIRGISQFKS